MEGHTPCLREFAARIVWEYGSLEAFADCAAASGHCDFPYAVNLRNKLHYILIIAQKENTS
jgi:hypothetical protein